MTAPGDVTWFGAPPERARRVALLLHGRDQDPQQMHELVVRRLPAAATAGVAFAAPAAPGRTWYPASFLAPEEDNQPALAAALARIAALVAELAALGHPPREQLLVGFSQGACLACAYLLGTPTPPAALFAYTGGLPGVPGTVWPAARVRLHGVRVILSGAARDVWVPATRMRETVSVFASEGAAIAFALRDDDRHEISESELTLLAAALAPAEDAGRWAV